MVATAFRTNAIATATSTTVAATLNIDIGDLNNRLALVFMSVDSGQVSAVTIDGVNATLLHEVIQAEVSGCSQVTSVWYMLDADLPTTTGNISVQATTSISDVILMAASLYTGIKQQPAEALAKLVVNTTGNNWNLNITSITANAMGFSAPSVGCGFPGGDTPATGFTWITPFANSSSSAIEPAYNLNLGAAGTKLLDPSTGSGYARHLASVWEIDTVAPIPPIPVAFRTKISATATSTTISATLNIDIGNLNNRLALVALSVDSGQVSAVTIDGVNATLLHELTQAEVGGCNEVNSVWYMLDADLPATTGNVTVQATTSISDFLMMSASLYTGLKQQPAEALGKMVIQSPDGTLFNVNVTSITANAMGFTAPAVGCGFGIGASPATGFTLIDYLGGGASALETDYNLDLGVAGLKTFDPSPGFGQTRNLGSAWETNIVPEAPPTGNTNAAAIMMGSNF